MKFPEYWHGAVMSLTAAPAFHGRLRGEPAQKIVFVFYELDGELHCDFNPSGGGSLNPEEWCVELLGIGKNKRMRPIVGGHADDTNLHFWWGRVEQRLIREALINSYARESEPWEGLLNRKVTAGLISEVGFDPYFCLGTLREIVNPRPNLSLF
jgi:hypothetical protein